MTTGWHGECTHETRMLRVYRQRRVVMCLFCKLWILALLVSPIVGCNELTNTKPYLFITSELDADGERILPGVEICENETTTTNCKVTDASGEVILELPADEEVSFTAQKDGYEARLDADVTDERFGERAGRVHPVRRVRLRSDERAADWYRYLESQYPMIGVGRILVYLSPAFEGATFDLRGATGTPYYFVEPPADFPATADLNLEATTSDGGGGFLRVPPDENIQIELGGTDRECDPERAWEGDAKNRIRFPVREGHVTVVSAICEL
jgi:hypothetical protein